MYSPRQYLTTPAKNPAAPVFTVVTAQELEYTEDDRLAHYRSGAHLKRPGLDVTSQEIRAFLKDSKEDSSLDHAFADGQVVIIDTTPERTRTGTSEHSEYYADDNRVVLTGGQPQLVDSLKGTTKGKKLTYFADDERLLVNGEEKEPVKSKLLKKKKK